MSKLKTFYHFITFVLVCFYLFYFYIRNLHWQKLSRFCDFWLRESLFSRSFSKCLFREYLFSRNFSKCFYWQHRCWQLFFQALQTTLIFPRCPRNVVLRLGWSVKVSASESFCQRKFLPVKVSDLKSLYYFYKCSE